MKLLLLFLFAQASALIEWPFHEIPVTLNGIVVNVTIGTPGKTFGLQIVTYNEKCPGLIVPSTKLNSRTGFDPNASSTFKKTGDYDKNSDVGIKGLDDFIITSSTGKQQKLTQKSFNVLNQMKTELPTLSLSHDNEDITNSFLNLILQDQDERVVVLTYDRNSAKDPEGVPSAGSLYIGGRPESCADEWQTFPETSVEFLEEQWNIDIDKVHVGKFSAWQPGVVRFSTYSPDLFVSPGTYDTIYKELGIFEERVHFGTVRKIPCDTTTELIFTLNGIDIHVKPEDYIDKSSNNAGNCNVKLWSTDDENTFVFPKSLLTRYCLLYNYDQKQIELANLIV